MKALLLGDMSPTDDNAQLFEHGDVQALFADTQTLFAQSDVSIVNLECAVTESEIPITKVGPPLKAPLGTAKTLKKLGVTYCNLSNNHFFDYGRKGAMDSINALKEAGIGYTGFGDNELDSRKNLIIEKDGETVCVIAVCEHEYSYALEDRMGARAFDVFETPLEIRSAKEQYDRVVVLYHGGKELCQYPSPRLRKACRTMVKSGADVVLCQHTHCIGAYEEFEGGHILYGQGNFHFVKEKKRDDPMWLECLAVTYDTKTNEISFTPVVATTDTYGIRLANAEESEAILSAFAQRNASLHDGTWLNGWRAFCESVQEQYSRVLLRAGVPENGERATQLFAHYLDCEAHTDVWKELYKTYNDTNEK